jgi:importin subunit beta-1
MLTAYSDIAQTFPKGEFAVFYRSDWLLSMVKETRGNANYVPKTIETARWAREQLKRQASLA